MRMVPLDAATLETWNAIAATSGDSWFWHTPEWLGFAKTVGAAAFVADHSAILYVDRDPIAICPVIVEARDGYRRLSYLGEYLPFPAFHPSVTAVTRARAIDYYAEWIAALAAENDVAYARVFTPVLSERAESAEALDMNPLRRHGYLDLSFATQVVSLDHDRETLWHGVRKGHRSDIKRAAEQCEVHAWDATTLTEDRFDAYRELHALDAGRVTRDRTTFDMMRGWIRDGHGVLMEARLASGAAVAFAVVLVYRAGAYYASSCKDPRIDVPAMHLLQWRTIEWLKARGVRRYDLGMQYFGPSWHQVPSAKDLSIAAFKRGFGGSTRRVDVVERFFSPAVMARVGADRIKALTAQQEHFPA